MPPSPHASIGIALDEVDPPALVLALDALERNLLRMVDAVKGSGVRLRPHAKSHKCAEIARRQIAAGAVGVCCQKVSEAEALVAGGVADVLITNQIVDMRKMERLAKLAQNARVAVCVDNLDNLEALAKCASANGVILDTLVEVEVGGNRCGVPPDDGLLGFVAKIQSLTPIRFRGIHAYHGLAQHIRTPGDRQRAISESSAKTRAAVAILAR